MTKWKCEKKECELAPCKIEMDFKNAPNCCPAMIGHFSEWKKDETTTNCNQLTDWCKVGEWVYYANEEVEEDYRYLKVTEIKNDGVSAKEKHGGGSCWISFCALKQFAKPAHLRPWTAREAIGKVICWEGDCTHEENIAIINAVDFAGFVHGNLIGSDDLDGLTKDCFYQPDGSPCGVLEHLEDGEWVQ